MPRPRGGATRHRDSERLPLSSDGMSSASAVRASPECAAQGDGAVRPIRITEARTSETAHPSVGMGHGPMVDSDPRLPSYAGRALAPASCCAARGPSPARLREGTRLGRIPCRAVLAVSLCLASWIAPKSASAGDRTKRRVPASSAGSLRAMPVAQRENPGARHEESIAQFGRSIPATVAELSTELRAVRRARQDRTQGAGADLGQNAPHIVIVRHTRARTAQRAKELGRLIDLGAALEGNDRTGSRDPSALGDGADEGVDSPAAAGVRSGGLDTRNPVGPVERTGRVRRSSPTPRSGQTTGREVLGSRASPAEPTASHAAPEGALGRLAPTGERRAYYGEPHVLLRPYLKYRPADLTSEQRELLRLLFRRILESTNDTAQLTSDEAGALQTLTTKRDRFTAGTTVKRPEMETVLFGSVVRWLIQRTARKHQDLAWTGLPLDELQQAIAARSQSWIREWAQNPNPFWLTTYVGNAIHWQAGALAAQYRQPAEFGGSANYHALAYLAARIGKAVEALRAPGASPSDEDIATWINAHGALKRVVSAKRVTAMRRRMEAWQAVKASSEVDPRWRRYDEERPDTAEAVPPGAAELVSDHDRTADPVRTASDRQVAKLIRREIVGNGNPTQVRLTHRHVQVLDMLFGLGLRGSWGRGHELTRAEVAEALGVTEGGVSVLLRQALGRLRRHWETWGPFFSPSDLLPD